MRTRMMTNRGFMTCRGVRPLQKYLITTQKKRYRIVDMLMHSIPSPFLRLHPKEGTNNIDLQVGFTTMIMDLN